jgi:FAD-dependent urate hydroxylase
MRILIVGVGIGGMTLAALLERRVVRPTLIEQAPSFEHAGYMLGLYSLGSRVLYGLGLYERFADRSVETDCYEVRDDYGRAIKSWSMGALARAFGPMLSSTRLSLIRILHEGLHETSVRFRTTVETLTQTAGGVDVTFNDDSKETFDLVVGAVGMRSRVRDLVFGDQPSFDTVWDGWVWWADRDSIPPKTFVEWWGVGQFLGAYPTDQGVGVFAGAAASDGFDDPGLSHEGLTHIPRPGHDKRRRDPDRVRSIGWPP